jgi:energy-coupling factor transport system substrate-specific component
VWREAWNEIKSRRGLKVALLTMVIYVLLLLPFKQFVLIDAITEVRPAGAIPVVMAVLLGPGAALGAAFGNLLGDACGGTLTISSIPGFLGNFALAFVAWAVWTELGSNARRAFGLKAAVHFVIAAIVASVVCALIIATGVQLLGMAPLPVLFGIIALNNITWTCTLGLFLAWGMNRWVAERHSDVPSIPYPEN